MDKSKISSEELKSLQEAIGNVNQAKTILGDITTQAYLAQIQVLEKDKALQEEQKTLEEKYGSISVDINTGEYEDVVEEAETVE
tara:strand:+ start:637 stop:888 length:252 start_codon:yes stop_codon:yes gene_type:complete